ncbi:MAG TPA: hypothetical protein VI792_10200 [Candidatus Eisenbacteria bacterium]
MPASSPTRRRAAPVAPPPPVRPLHPAEIAAVVVAALCLVVSVSFPIDDPDLWQHLLVGKAIWAHHAIPALNLWTWPTWGARQVLPSWGFRALLWPVWQAGGLWGLFAWRWLTTLAAFALLWAAARRLGARGTSALVVIVVCGLVYRQRSQVRPETLVAVLLALELWILETRRAGGPDRSPWLIAVACAWANVHISYPLGLALLGIHALADLLPPRGGHRRTRLLLVGLGAVAASFVNPFGWRALAQPFAFALAERHEAIFRGIGELQPVQWSINLRNGLPLIVAGWPLLMAWRWRRAGPDLAEGLTLALAFWLGLSTQRFVSLLALAAAPYLARDLDALLASTPAARAPVAWRASLAALLCVAGALPEWSRRDLPLRLSLETTGLPVTACDFIAAHGVRGRGFNPFHFGGYMLWRFWPDPGRLPFMDIHQTGTREDRALATAAFVSRPRYRELLARHRFDYALLDRSTPAERRLLDFFDEDTTWALVFADDAAALFVRRAGPLAAVADSFAYVAWPAGAASLERIAERYASDPEARAPIDRELARQVAASPWNAGAHVARANLAMMLSHEGEARRELLAALAVDPALTGAHAWLGMIALRAGRPDEALAEFERERRLTPGASGLDTLIARARAARAAARPRP